MNHIKDQRCIVRVSCNQWITQSIRTDQYQCSARVASEFEVLEVFYSSKPSFAVFKLSTVQLYQRLLWWALTVHKSTQGISVYVSIQTTAIQGSGLGPAVYLVTSADQRPVQGGNHVIKFADNTYLIVPVVNYGSYIADFVHINDWTEKNNLWLNSTVWRLKKSYFKQKWNVAVECKFHSEKVLCDFLGWQRSASLPVTE